MMRPLFCVVSAAVLLSIAGSARAQTPEGSPQDRARVHFQRGRAAFDAGDNATALAELETAQRLAPHPAVRFNIALVQAAAGRPVEAVALADELLAAPAGLSGAQVERLRSMRAEQGARVGVLTITSNVPAGTAGTVELDGTEVGRLGPELTIKVSTGRHVVAVVASGYAPSRREVMVASGPPQALAFEPVKLEGRLANIALSTATPDADVLVDGAPVGRTPLAAPISVTPGAHTISLRRPGYFPAQQALTLGEGVRADVALTLSPDPAAPADALGSLRVRPNETAAQVFLDDQPLSTTSERSVPAGPHRLRVERSGFRSLDLVVRVPARGSLDLPITLEPTPEFLQDYKSRVGFRRTLSFAAIAVGAVGVGGGVGFLVYNAGQKADKQKAKDAAISAFDRKEGVCNNSSPSYPEQCNAQLELTAYEQRVTARRDVYGFVGIGVGAALAGTGIVLLALGDDPKKYDRPASDSPYAAAPRIRAVATPGGLSFVGAF